MVLFRLLCPVSFSLDISAFNLLPAKQTDKGRIEYTVPDIIVENIAPQQETGIGDIVVAPQLGEMETTPQYTQTQPDKTENTIVMAPQQKIDYINIMAVLWIAGVFYMLADNLISLYEIKLLLADSEKLYGNVYRSNTINTAFIIGVIKPKIYLPKNISRQRQRYIILHEEIHLKRKDYLFKFIGFVALALHWFNPLVWLAYKLAEKDMEMSCDEAVIRQIGPGEKKGYSQTLLSLSRPFGEYRAMHLAFGEGETKQRIINVLNFKRPQAKYVAGIICVISMAGVLLVSNPALNNAATLIDDVYDATQFIVVMPDGYYTVDGNLAYTVADNLKKTKVMETEEINTEQGENYIFCTAPDKQYTINFNEDYSKLWLLDETSEINGKVYNIANTDSSGSIGSFINANRENTVYSYIEHKITFPSEKYKYSYYNIFGQIGISVNVELPQGWKIFAERAVDDSELVHGGPVMETAYIVNSFGETAGAISYGLKSDDIDSAIGLMNYITSYSSITFNTNDWRVWPNYGEIAFTTCSYLNNMYDNYCVLA